MIDPGQLSQAELVDLVRALDARNGELVAALGEVLLAVQGVCAGGRVMRGGVAQVRVDGELVYVLRDDLGMVWAGGWRTREAAELALSVMQECGWDADQCPEPDVPLDDSCHG